MYFYHFDINGTIMGYDSYSGGKYAVNDALSKYYLKGKIINNEFIPHPLGKPYYNFVKERNIIDNISDNYPFIEDVKNKLKEVYQNGLFPSFIKFMETKIGNDKLIIRTFGRDRDFIIDLLKKYGNFTTLYATGKNFYLDPEYKNCVNFKEIVWNSDYLLVVDDYKYWEKNGKKREFGKYIQHIDGVEQICFDDNNCMFTDSPESVFIYKISPIEAALNEKFYCDIVDGI